MVSNTLRNKGTGLTLTELLIVMTIIMLLLVIGLVSYRAQIFKGYDARRKTDLHQIKVGLEEYEKDHDCYPDTLDCGVKTGTALDPYMGDNVPCDPGTGQAYEYHPEGVACSGWFWLFTDLDYEEDPRILDVGCITGCGPSLGETDYNYYVSSPNAPDVFVAPYPYYACLPGNVCQGILAPGDCHPHYGSLGDCENPVLGCPAQSTFCD